MKKTCFMNCYYGNISADDGGQTSCSTIFSYNSKTVRLYPFVFTGEEHDEETSYGYCNEYQPHAVKRMFDYNSGMLYDMRWDEAGNLGQVSLSKTEKMFEAGRFLFWTEDNRMHAAVDDRYFSYYAYDHSGERRLKLTGDNKLLDVNADFMATYTILNEPTLYPSAYMVLNNKGYTKHYYAGTERVAARLGGGGLDALYHVIGNDVELQKKADILFKQSLEQVNHRVLRENNLECIKNNEFTKEELSHWIDGIPYQMKAEVEIDHGQFKDMVNSMLTDYHNGEENEVYFYHSDHLGSASWITDFSGMAVQHLQYLPYGEPYVNQHPFGYSERFTFTGKERDEETGYGYFGARYMDHELMTMWLSVDPMADKYPSISPYAYCAWNPVKLVDPDGRDWYEYVHPETHKTMVRWTESHNQDELNNELKGSGIDGNYLGVTAETTTKYFGLMGDIVDKNEKQGEHYRLVKDLDRAIINRSMGTAFGSNTVNFSDVFAFEEGGVNTRLGYLYAGGEAGISMNGKQEDGKRVGMEGRFNEMRKDDGRSLRSYGMQRSLDAPRFSINAVNLRFSPEMAAISFARDPSKAAVFQQRYEGLKGRPLYHAQRIGQGWRQTKYR